MKKNTNNTLLFIAGEVSGDLHGSRVLSALRELNPDVEIFGIGGQRMAEQGQEQLYDINEMAIIGFTEVIRHLPFLRRVFRHLEKEIIARKPACAVLIDYPGFNLRLAKILKKYKIPVFWYIAPQVWAWHKSRIQQMVKYLDHLAVVFPFEKPLFHDAGLPTTFVGHPLLEVLREEMSEETFLQTFEIPTNAKILALLPGSRKQEVQRLLPTMLETAKLLEQQTEQLQVIIAQSSNLSTQLYEQYLAAIPLKNCLLLQNVTYSIMKHSMACIVASGTATLETGCFETPMAIVYRVSPLTYAIGKVVVKLKNIGLVNIVAGESVVPEFVQNDFKPENVATYIENMLTDMESAQNVRSKLSMVRSKLGHIGASQKVAKLIAGIAWPD
ncbi:MAG: lipid-A-disaccharide synthase [Deferribacteres bacterium]|nr:lipid-A-disaccharide synthase [candidate division KSB1 bacterium]MCB9503045.1 lipid-A-disaccharide synthase [Deferribacteres bacterium]